MARLTKTMGIAGGVFMLISGSAYANHPADTNADGQISQAEFIAAADERFASTDANGDGVITSEERAAHRTQKHAERETKVFDKMDANGDGFISREEFSAAGDNRKERRKGRLDANKDGQIDDADRSARKERFKEMRAQRKERSAQMKQGGGEREKRPKVDANEDGVVTLAEHQTATLAMFERLDVNKDGFLTKGEGRKRKRGKRGPR